MPAIRTTSVRASSAVKGEKSQKIDLQRFASGSSATLKVDEKSELDDQTDFSVLGMFDFQFPQSRHKTNAYTAASTTDFPLGESRTSYRRKDGKVRNPRLDTHNIHLHHTTESYPAPMGSLRLHHEHPLRKSIHLQTNLRRPW